MLSNSFDTISLPHHQQYTLEDEDEGLYSLPPPPSTLVTSKPPAGPPSSCRESVRTLNTCASARSRYETQPRCSDHVSARAACHHSDETTCPSIVTLSGSIRKRNTITRSRQSSLSKQRSRSNTVVTR